MVWQEIKNTQTAPHLLHVGNPNQLLKNSGSDKSVLAKENTESKKLNIIKSFAENRNVRYTAGIWKRMT